MASSNGAPMAVILQPYLPDYRVPLFEELRQRLTAEGVGLRLIVSTPRGAQAFRKDSAHLDWAHHTRQLGPFTDRLPIRVKLLPINLLREANVVVGELASGCLESILLALGPIPFISWGHGFSSVRVAGRLDHYLESLIMRRSHKVLVYTAKGRDQALRAGVSPESVTVLNNTIDTRPILRALNVVGDAEETSFRREMGLSEGPNVAYIGGLDESKRIDWVLETAVALHVRFPALHLFIGGDGVLRSQVEDFCRHNNWAHYSGRVNTGQKALIARCCHLLLNPGRVGLIAVDSLSMALPLATTNWNCHAPEFAYLNEKTALITVNTLESYIADTTELLSNMTRLHAMSHACRAEAPTYSIEAMADRFSEAVIAVIRGKKPCR